jgi:hypothetical protein
MQHLRDAPGPMLPRPRHAASSPSVNRHGLNPMLCVRIGMLGTTGNVTQEYWPSPNETALMAYIFTNPLSVVAWFLGGAASTSSLFLPTPAVQCTQGPPHPHARAPSCTCTAPLWARALAQGCSPAPTPDSTRDQ